MIRFNQSLAALLEQLNLAQIAPAGQIQHVCFDSREVSANDAYVAMPSVAGNELTFALSAQEKGAVVVFAQQDFSGKLSIPCIVVPDLISVFGPFLHDQLGRVCEQMAVVGITGTNGKSSISFYLAQLLNALKRPCAVMGTLGYGDWKNLQTTGMTTLPLEPLHQSLAQLNTQYQAVAMEVSSHGLDQNRLSGVQFTGAVFSNLSRDHLDYHGTMDAYAKAKALLFSRPELEFAVVNGDDEYAALIIEHCLHPVTTYGKKTQSDLKWQCEALHANGMVVRFTWRSQSQQVSLPLYGEFNAANVAAALACVVNMGVDFNAAITALSAIEPVPGRMQQIKPLANKPLVLVDYAHTPDALEQALIAIKAHCVGKIVLVVGCGGDRDQGKRPLMGKIAVDYADKVVFTSDNPRSESALFICEQMSIGLVGGFDIELDRKQAIQQAILCAQPEDIILIAGKGHEDYQEINGQRSYFSDEVVAREALQLEISP